MRLATLAKFVIALALVAGAPAGGSAEQTASPAAAALDRHLEALAAHDVEAIMADYGDDAVFITPQGVLQGKAQIRPLFEALVEEFSAPEVSVTVHERYDAGPMAYITWSAETPQHSYRFATDTLYVVGGLIRYQTFAATVAAK